MKKLINKYSEIISYVIVGGFTTVVSLASYYLLILTVLDSNNGIQLQMANIISWILAVTFAFFTNKKYVFKTENSNKISEVIKFFGSRVSTLLIDMFLMFLMVTILKIDAKIAKIIVQFIVLILNYIFSKFFVFNKSCGNNQFKS